MTAKIMKLTPKPNNTPAERTRYIFKCGFCNKKLIANYPPFTAVKIGYFWKRKISVCDTCYELKNA